MMIRSRWCDGVILVNYTVYRYVKQHFVSSRLDIKRPYSAVQQSIECRGVGFTPTDKPQNTEEQTLTGCSAISTMALPCLAFLCQVVTHPGPDTCHASLQAHGFCVICFKGTNRKSVPAERRLRLGSACAGDGRAVKCWRALQSGSARLREPWLQPETFSVLMMQVCFGWVNWLERNKQRQSKQTAWTDYSFMLNILFTSCEMVGWSCTVPK